MPHQIIQIEGPGRDVMILRGEGGVGLSSSLNEDGEGFIFLCGRKFCKLRVRKIVVNFLLYQKFIKYQP